ncbi:wax ester synthase-like acyl-CoA acyltransferase domain-containing protein [Cladochytrium replicatum]|nr:wax ester synthase-like acyl-CoA acyltransferase domain-containing protein [Cladochytrium replicatum]
MNLVMEGMLKADNAADLSKHGYLTAVDNVFLRAEDDVVTVNVSAIYFFNRLMDYDELLQTIRDFVEVSGYCNRKLVWRNGAPDHRFLTRARWVPADDIDMSYHVKRIVMPSPGSKSQFQTIVAAEHYRPFDLAMPLWRVAVVDGFENGTKTAVVMSAHHLMGDGQAFVRRLIEFVASRDPKFAGNQEAIDALQYHAGRVETDTAKATPPGTPPSTELLSPEEKAKFETYMNEFKEKRAKMTWFDKFLERTLFVLATIFALFVLLFKVIDLFLVSSHNMFSRPHRSTKRQVGWSMAAKLDQVKTIKNALNCTVNDVLMACVAAAIERTVASKKCKVDRKLWMLIPTSLRLPTDRSIANKVSVYMLPVATGMGSNSIGRVREVNKSMKMLKSSPEPFVTVGVMSLGFLRPYLLPEWLVQWGKKKFHVLLTNIPGPSKEMQWAGEPIESMVAFPPQSHANGLAVALYTYKGQVSVSVCMAEDDYSLPSDRDTHPNDTLFAPGTAQAIADEFDIVFKDLLQQASSLSSRDESKKDR